jgi:hypothetical protein
MDFKSDLPHELRQVIQRLKSSPSPPWPTSRATIPFD